MSTRGETTMISFTVHVSRSFPVFQMIGGLPQKLMMTVLTTHAPRPIDAPDHDLSLCDLLPECTQWGCFHGMHAGSGQHGTAMSNARTATSGSVHSSHSSCQPAHVVLVLLSVWNRTEDLGEKKGHQRHR